MSIDASQRMLLHKLLPVGLGMLMGLAIWHRRLGEWRLGLTVTAVTVIALASTALSGEVVASWLYPLLDLTESATGFCAAAMLRVCLADWRRAKHSRAVVAP